MTTANESGRRRIENEEQYQKSLEWLVKTAIELEDPLLDDETRSKKQQQYDFVESGILRYKRSELIKKFPNIKGTYDQLGWEYDDPFEHELAPQQEPMKEEAKQPAADYSWLDDD